MNRPKPLSLIASGRMTDTLLTRHPVLARDLGWVRAPSLRVASRFTGLLRAGEPAAALEEACASPLVFIQVETAAIAPTVDEMAAARQDWREATVVLLHPDCDSLSLARLQAAGAAVGSLAVIEPSRGPLLLVEGDERARAVIRRRIREARIRAVELEPGAKALYLASRTAVSALLAPLMEHSIRSMRAAGVGSADVRRILEPAVESAIRSHFSAGRKAWSSPALPGRREPIVAQIGVLRQFEPAQADYFVTCLRASLELFGQDSGWVEPASAHGGGASN
jgi:hypothetical protein